MKLISGLLFVLLLNIISISFASAAHDVTLQNDTDWDIHELYFSPTKAEDWGDDQLGKKTIPSGTSFKLTGIPTGKYDVKIVDDEGDECVVEKVRILDSEEVVIDNDMLLDCQEASEVEDEEE